MSRTGALCLIEAVLKFTSAHYLLLVSLRLQLGDGLFVVVEAGT